MDTIELLLRGTGLVLMWLSAIQLKRIVDRMDDANDLFRRIDARVVNELAEHHQRRRHQQTNEL